MKIKKKFFLNFFLLFLIFYFVTTKKINALGSDNRNLLLTQLENISEKKFTSLETLKNTFPQYLKTSDSEQNKLLLAKALEIILEEFDKSYYSWEKLNKNNNLETSLELLDKYNIINEFENTIAESVFDTEKYIFVFPGNEADVKNYNAYLYHKERKFRAKQGYYWAIWHPSNLEFISKKKIEYILDIFKQIITLEKENKDTRQLKEELYQYEIASSQQQKFIMEQSHLINFLRKQVLDQRNEILLNLENAKSLKQSLENNLEELKKANFLTQKKIQQLNQENQQISQDLLSYKTTLNEKKGVIQQLEQQLNQLGQQLTTKTQEVVALQTMNAES
ncbi:MAG: hypothetical protein Q8899_01720, partial [Weeping tea tree witches'-broom phytoplasma]|uniref:hypothetical protein n=1 Tax=Candidatus Phytoplasma melaleucae TaxID=2982630 RepID=UPI00293987A4|nr:hypothetical protein [Weeping tea tree witches'-broom phytoplasma]